MGKDRELRLSTNTKQGKMEREKDKKNRANAPVGAVGGTNKGEY